MDEQKKQPHPNSLANLKPFKEGHDERRNYKGKPVVQDISRYIKERLAEPISQGSETTKLDAIIARMLVDAGKGDKKAMEMAIKYGFGNPRQSIELTGKDGQQLITHDFSKLNNDQLGDRIAKLESAIALGSGAGGHVTTESPEGGEQTA